MVIMYFITTILALSFLFANAAQDDDLTRLKLTTGAIKGRKMVTDRKTTAYLFQGIPFAEPPIGDLRFRAPVAKKPWKGELSTQDYTFTCMFSKIMVVEEWSARNMSEDCLHMNVFTTEKCLVNKNCPVMYYIHGGAWNFDSPFLFANDFLIDNYQSKDIVLVTHAYRMGPLGFFNAGKKTSADKNLGLLDMILGLQWAQREIATFGGDKNRVTIMGHSSGAQAVDQLSLSPKTAGLFQQIVIMSGPAGMVELSRDSNVEQSKAFAIAAGCATEDLWNAGDSFEDILKCLRSKTAIEMVTAQKAIEDEGQQFPGPMMDDENGILPQSNAALMSKRRPYRMLIGTTNREFRVGAMLVDEGVVNKQLLLSACVLMAKMRGFVHPEAVGRACAEDYSKRPLDVADMIDDLMIYVPTYEAGESMRHKGATVYKYSFEYGKIGAAFVSNLSALVDGPFHAQDLVYVMGLHYNVFTPKDQVIRRIYSGMFADFVISGDPSPPTHPDKWQPTDDRNNYFKINFDDDNNMPGNTDGYHAAAIKFWTKTAPELDKYDSKWDFNGTFDFKKLIQDLMQRLKDMTDDEREQLREVISKWSDNIKDMDQDKIDKLKKVLNDLLQRIFKNKDDERDDQRSHMIKQFSQQLVRNSLPVVRDTNVAASGATDWKMWFWVATGVAAVLAILLLLTCTCHQRSKRTEYERLNETTRLNPTSSKMYG